MCHANHPSKSTISINGASCGPGPSEAVFQSLPSLVATQIPSRPMTEALAWVLCPRPRLCISILVLKSPRHKINCLWVQIRTGHFSTPVQPGTELSLFYQQHHSLLTIQFGYSMLTLPRCLFHYNPPPPIRNGSANFYSFSGFGTLYTVMLPYSFIVIPEPI